MKRRWFFLALGLLLHLSAAGSGDCSLFLSPQWFRDRREVNRARRQVNDAYRGFSLSTNSEFLDLKKFYTSIRLLSRSTQALSAITEFEAHPEYISKAQRLARKMAPVLRGLGKAKNVLQNSSSPLAQKDAAHEALDDLSQLEDAYRLCREVEAWPTELPLIALTEGLAKSLSALRMPAMYLSPGFDPAFFESRLSLYRHLFHKREEVSELLEELQSASWDIHFLARAWVRADLLLQEVMSAQRTEPIPTERAEIIQYFDHERHYFRTIAQETSDILTLLERIRRQHQQGEAPLRESLEEEWTAAKNLALLYSDPEVDRALRAAERNPFQDGPTPQQQSYLQSVETVTDHLGRNLGPLELASEAERRIQSATTFHAPTFAFWIWCREAKTLSDKALRRILYAEKMGLYDGHGMDPSRPESVELGRAQVLAENVQRRLLDLGCPHL